MLRNCISYSSRKTSEITPQESQEHALTTWTLLDIHAESFSFISSDTKPKLYRNSAKLDVSRVPMDDISVLSIMFRHVYQWRLGRDEISSPWRNSCLSWLAQICKICRFGVHLKNSMVYETSSDIRSTFKELSSTPNGNSTNEISSSSGYGR